jgi:hypothetical protein
MSAKRLLVGAALLLAATPVLAQKVNVDYDKTFDFSKVETYQWVDPQQDATNPLMVQRLHNAIDYHMSMKGVRKVDSNPDVFLTYSTSSKEEFSVSSTSMGYGYGAGWYGYGGGSIGMSSTNVSSYQVGTLVIDVWDAKTKNLVWRGTAEGTVVANPEKMEHKLTTALEKLYDKWEKMAKKGGVKTRPSTAG